MRDIENQVFFQKKVCFSENLQIWKNYAERIDFFRGSGYDGKNMNREEHE